jgi:hypothetical protein
MVRAGQDLMNEVARKYERARQDEISSTTDI